MPFAKQFGLWAARFTFSVLPGRGCQVENLQAASVHKTYRLAYKRFTFVTNICFLHGNLGCPCENTIGIKFKLVLFGCKPKMPEGGPGTISIQG